jgi:glycerol-3-phosphate dehydrogenase
VLQGSALGAGLKPAYTNGFSYYDARADDARLTILNARGAADLGATIAPYTRFVSARAVDGIWQVVVQDVATQAHATHRARAIVNAAGPWVMRVLGGVQGLKPSAERVRHVKGSHIVVPRVHPGEHAYLLQNRDKRIVFVIPFHEQYTLIGTTDIAVEAWDRPEISGAETDYLCAIASEYLVRPLTPRDVVWSYSGVRPLYDDGQANASAITRDYVLKLDLSAGAPMLNVFGGKLTTYRKLAEHALEKLTPHVPAMRAPWTGDAALPGGAFTGGLESLVAGLKRAYPFVPPPHLGGMARRHGTLAQGWLDGATRLEDLGEHFGAGLYAAEVKHMIATEWVQNGTGACAGADEAVLMRRSKCGLFMNQQQKARVSAYLHQT